jgi:hypothetical protein
MSEVLEIALMSQKVKNALQISANGTTTEKPSAKPAKRLSKTRR